MRSLCLNKRRTQTPTDEVNIRMQVLLLELLRSAESESLPKWAVGGAWFASLVCFTGRPAVARKAMEIGMYELAVAQMRAIDPADWLVRYCLCSVWLACWAGVADTSDLCARALAEYLTRSLLSGWMLSIVDQRAYLPERRGD